MKRAPWMRDLPPPAPRRVVYAVLPWRGDGRYRLEQAVKVYRRRGDADRRAAKDDTGTLCVRELDAPTSDSQGVPGSGEANHRRQDAAPGCPVEPGDAAAVDPGAPPRQAPISTE